MILGRSNIYGVGINDWFESVHEVVNGKKVPIKEYRLWRSMLSRCYSDYTEKVRPTYISVSCVDEWLSMTKFIEDVSGMIGYEKSFSDGWVLDKDILNKGNKIYSPEKCAFVPQEVNGTLTLRSKHRGDLPLGVRFSADFTKYVARCGFNGSRLNLGRFDTIEEAFDAYVTCKKMELKRLANKYKDELDARVYNALINYEFSVDD